ncbi:MAG: SMC-Scp complex subunit ScpB [Actinobacteria bacterium]|nr:SMC-Scp complex subunit ScpB [Actinomycetota bacterium]
MPPEDRWDRTEEGGIQPPEEAEQHATEVDKKAVLEALLLVAPEPLSIAGLAELTGFSAGEITGILNELRRFYDERGGGLVIREVAGGFCFYSSPDAAQYVARLISSRVNPRLTRAALETLAIVAYLQPVSRGVIAEIRGIQSEVVIKTLEDRGLVQAVGRGGPPGYPNLYATTVRFLERFGLNSLADLPDLEQFTPDDETVEKVKKSLSWELSEEDMSAGSGKARKDPEDTGESGDGFPPGGGEVDS